MNEPSFSFRRALNDLQTNEVPKVTSVIKPEDLGYAKEEVFTTKENLTMEDLKAYSEEGEEAFKIIPLLPPSEELCA